MPFDQANYRPLPTGLQRLLTLADYLETQVPPHLFDMRKWGCGTTGCALHFAGMIPEFQAAGYSCGSTPTFAGQTSYEAAGGFLGMSAGDAYRMFNGLSHGGETPREVAARIREYVAAKELVL